MALRVVRLPRITAITNRMGATNPAATTWFPVKYVAIGHATFMAIKGVEIIKSKIGAPATQGSRSFDEEMKSTLPTLKRYQKAYVIDQIPHFPPVKN